VDLKEFGFIIDDCKNSDFHSTVKWLALYDFEENIYMHSIVVYSLVTGTFKKENTNLKNIYMLKIIV